MIGPPFQKGLQTNSTLLRFLMPIGLAFSVEEAAQGLLPSGKTEYFLRGNYDFVSKQSPPGPKSPGRCHSLKVTVFSSSFKPPRNAARLAISSRLPRQVMDNAQVDEQNAGHLGAGRFPNRMGSRHR